MIGKVRWHLRLQRGAFLALLLAAGAFAQSSGIPASGAPAEAEAWFYLGRQNESGAWAPASRSFRFDTQKEPKRVTVLRDAVLVDDINPDPAAAAGDPEAAKWTRVVRRGPAAIPLLDVVRQDSVGRGKLVWAKVRVPGERVQVTQRG